MAIASSPAFSGAASMVVERDRKYLKKNGNFAA
jgi:hypothetical protein